MSQTVQSYAVDKAGTGLHALEKLPGLGKGCQGSKLCSILQVSERYVRLCSLAAVNRAGTGGPALQTLEKFPGSNKDCQGSRLCSILEVFERCLRLCSLMLLTRQGQACMPWRSFQDQARATKVPSFAVSYNYLKNISDCAVLQGRGRYLSLAGLRDVGNPKNHHKIK